MAMHTTPTSPRAWRPDVTAFVPDQVVPSALLMQTSTVVGSVEGDEPSVRVPFVSDDGTSSFVPEGEAISEAAQQFSETIVSTDKVATLGTYSRETLMQPGAAQMVVQSLNRNIVNSADRAYLANESAPTGVFNAGILDAGEVGGNLDLLQDALLQVETAGGKATHIIASPAAWGYLSKLKSGSDSNATLLGAGTQQADRIVLSTPVLVTAAMPPAAILVVDRSAILSAVGPVRTDRSEDAFFDRDALAVRSAWRVGWSVMRPERVLKMSTPSSDG